MVRLTKNKKINCALLILIVAIKMLQYGFKHFYAFKKGKSIVWFNDCNCNYCQFL